MEPSESSLEKPHSIDVNEIVRVFFSLSPKDHFVSYSTIFECGLCFLSEVVPPWGFFFALVYFFGRFFFVERSVKRTEETRETKKTTASGHLSPRRPFLDGRPWFSCVNFPEPSAIYVWVGDIWQDLRNSVALVPIFIL